MSCYIHIRVAARERACLLRQQVVEMVWRWTTRRRIMCRLSYSSAFFLESNYSASGSVPHIALHFLDINHICTVQHLSSENGIHMYSKARLTVSEPLRKTMHRTHDCFSASERNKAISGYRQISHHLPGRRYKYALHCTGLPELLVQMPISIILLPKNVSKCDASTRVGLPTSLFHLRGKTLVVSCRMDVPSRGLASALRQRHLPFKSR